MINGRGFVKNLVQYEFSLIRIFIGITKGTKDIPTKN